MTDFEIATVQFEPCLGDIKQSIMRLLPLLGQACERADLVVLPELSDTGYSLGSRDRAMALASPVEHNLLAQTLSTHAANHSCHIVGGICEREGDRLFNSSILVGPEGLVGTYRKLHLFMDEKDIFEPGNLGLPVFDIGPCNVGMLVCFDWYFPEVWRCLALSGADLICHPSNLVLPHAQRATPIHGMVNRVYVATANRIGSEDELTFTGRSQISGPTGELLATASKGNPETCAAPMDVSRARDKDVTSRNHAFEDRRPGEYKLITDSSRSCGGEHVVGMKTFK